MTNERTHYEEFTKRMGRYVDTKSDAETLERGSPEEKAKARLSAVARIEEALGEAGRVGAEHTDTAELAVKLGAYSRLDEDLARKYFEKNADKVIEEIPELALKRVYYQIAPQKVGNDRHDAIAETHARVLRLEEILNGFAEGKVSSFGKETLKEEVLNEALKQRFEELKSQTKDGEIIAIVLAVANDTLQRTYAHSDTLLVNAGTEVYKGAKKKLDNSFENYSKAEYARTNLYAGAGFEIRPEGGFEMKPLSEEVERIDKEIERLKARKKSCSCNKITESCESCLADESEIQTFEKSQKLQEKRTNETMSAMHRAAKSFEH